MRTRLLIGLAVPLVLKLVARYIVFATPSRALYGSFSAFDALVGIVVAPWIAMAPPRPDRGAALFRAATSAFLLNTGLVLTNVVMQLPEISARSDDSLEIVFRVLLQAIPQATIGGLVGSLMYPDAGLAGLIGAIFGGAINWLVAAGIATAWLRLRLPKETRQSRPRTAVAPARSGAPRPNGPARPVGATRAPARPPDRPGGRAGR